MKNNSSKKAAISEFFRKLKESKIVPPLDQIQWFTSMVSGISIEYSNHNFDVDIDDTISGLYSMHQGRFHFFRSSDLGTKYFGTEEFLNFIRIWKFESTSDDDFQGLFRVVGFGAESDQVYLEDLLDLIKGFEKFSFTRIEKAYFYLRWFGAEMDESYYEKFVFLYNAMFGIGKDSVIGTSVGRRSFLEEKKLFFC